ncbi:MAG: hypothetical protein K2P78_09480 [Gemmataceae bacterium]|nr:hypothetical protein [Gemmataceae bacterium]
MYRAYGLLQSGTDFAADEAANRLRARFPGYAVAGGGDRVAVSKSDWEIQLWVNADPTVLGESEGLSGRIAGLGPAEAAAVASCDRRVEVWSDTPDPFVEHLSDFHAVLGVLRTFTGVIVVDPKEPALM